MGLTFKRRKMKGIFLVFYCFMAVNILAEEINGLQTLKIKSDSSAVNPSPSSSPLISISPKSSLLPPIPSTANSPISQDQSQNGMAIPRKRRVRKRKLIGRPNGEKRVNKRQGSLEYETESTSPPRRELLYEEHADEHNVPDHYYSPIKKQRMKTSKLFKQDFDTVDQQLHTSYQQSPSIPNVDYRRRERKRQRNYDYLAQNDHNSEEFVPTTEAPPKNYAFAYAVRDGENSENSDFSHKEARDGQLTMGEYRINLPDGRVQVVRYTAGGNIGYKADVTYEGEGQQNNQDLTTKPKPNTQYGNNGYLPPNLSTASPLKTSYGRPKKSRPNKSYQNRYSAPTPTPSSQGYHREIAEIEHDDPTSYDKYDAGPIIANPTPSYYTKPAFQEQRQPSPGPTQVYRKRPRPSISYETQPLSATPSPITYSEGYDNADRPNKPYRKKKPQYERPQSEAQKKEYNSNNNLASLHDQSPRAGPESYSRPSSKRRRRPNNGQQSNGYEYPSHPEIEEEINALKKKYKPNQFFQEKLKPKSKKYNSNTGTPKQAMWPPALYKEPGPGNYFFAVNPSPSPTFSTLTPSQAPQPQYSKPSKPSFYASPSSTPHSNYIDDHEDHHNDHTVEEIDNQQNFRPSPPNYGSYTPINFKSGKGKELIPIEDFKAGPSRKNYNNKNRKQKQPQSRPLEKEQYFDDSPRPTRRPYKPTSTPQPVDVRYKEPYQYYNSQHPSYHHGGYTPPIAPVGMKQQVLNLNSPSPSPPATSYTIDFPGGKHSFYLKTGSKSSRPKYGSPTQEYSNNFQEPYKRKKNTGGSNGSGLVFFETPGIGSIRPTERVKDILSSFPNSNNDHLPEPHTTIHPYEVGAKDYGHSVGYKNSFNTPSSGEHHENKDEHHHNEEDDRGYQSLTDDNPNFSRDYLIDTTDDKIVQQEPKEDKRKYRLRTTQAPQVVNVHHFSHGQNTLNLLSPSPTPTFSTLFLSPTPAEPSQEISVDYQQQPQNLQLQPFSLLPSPTPSFSTSHFHQPLVSEHIHNTAFNDIDPRNVAENGQGELTNLDFGQQQQQLVQPQFEAGDVVYQYDNNEGVK